MIDDERLTFQIEFFNGLAFLHSEFRQRFTAMRIARTLLPQLKRWLREVGHEMVYVCIPEGDEMLHRFERHFGFVDLCRSRGYIIMGQLNG